MENGSLGVEAKMSTFDQDGGFLSTIYTCRLEAKSKCHWRNNTAIDGCHELRRKLDMLLAYWIKILKTFRNCILLSQKITCTHLREHYMLGLYKVPQVKKLPSHTLFLCGRQVCYHPELRFWECCCTKFLTNAHIRKLLCTCTYWHMTPFFLYICLQVSRVIDTCQRQLNTNHKRLRRPPNNRYTQNWHIPH